MKSLKFAVLATLVVFALVSVARADGIKEKPKPMQVINLTYAKAMATPGLAAAMHEQLSVDDYLNNPSVVFIAEVTLNGVLYRVTGTQFQWMLFFYYDTIAPVNVNEGVQWGIG